MAVPAAELEVGTLAGDDALLERLLFEAIDATEGDDIVAAVVRLHALAVRARAGDDAAAGGAAEGPRLLHNYCLTHPALKIRAGLSRPKP